MEVGDLVMFFFLANLFFDPVQAIGNQLNQALMAMAGAERLFRMLDQKPEWQDAADAKPLPAIKGHVEFQSVHFEYNPGRPVLMDISFTVEPGQSVALVTHRQRQDHTRGIAPEILSARRRSSPRGQLGFEQCHQRFIAIANG
jgi:ATP-binding cassette subfamily B protein